LKIWAEVLEGREGIRPGLYGVKGSLATYQNQPQFVVSEYTAITIEQYRKCQPEPVLPRAFSMDIETLALPGFRERVGPKLKEKFRLGDMQLEQQQRYLEDAAAEESTGGRMNSGSLRTPALSGVMFGWVV
jgi:hypothetical protein